MHAVATEEEGEPARRERGALCALCQMQILACEQIGASPLDRSSCLHDASTPLPVLPNMYASFCEIGLKSGMPPRIGNAPNKRIPVS